MTFPPYISAAYISILEKDSGFNKVAKVRQIEILLVLFLVSITGEIGEGWLISPGEQHSADIAATLFRRYTAHDDARTSLDDLKEV